MNTYAATRIAEIKKSVPLIGTRQGFVYFIAKGGMVKIGFTGDVEGRLAALRTASPEPLHLLECFSTHVETEVLLHEHFDADRACGEWFTMNPAIEDFMGDVFDYQGENWHKEEPEELSDVFIPVDAVLKMLNAL